MYFCTRATENLHPYLANNKSVIRQVSRLNSVVLSVPQDNAIFDGYNCEIWLVGLHGHGQTKFVTDEILERTFLLD